MFVQATKLCFSLVLLGSLTFGHTIANAQPSITYNNGHAVVLLPEQLIEPALNDFLNNHAPKKLVNGKSKRVDPKVSVQFD